MYFLPQLVGPSKAAELFYTGDMIDAKTALALGIVNQVVPAAQLEMAVKALAQKIAQGPSLPIRAVKKALFASEEKELAQALDNEVREQIRCYLSDDCREGIRAFFEKRHPTFQGK
jgi:2-(1,2-epoxy-1,2-dihydrophenyl)acetyl-CoA isomerase